MQRSKDYSKLLDDIIESELNQSFTDNTILWSAMGYELENQGIEKTLICTIMRKDIEDILYEKQFKEFMPRKDYHWHTRSYWLIIQSNGWSK